MSDPMDTVAESKRVFYGPWANSLFKSVKASGEFAETLRRAGYDPGQPADKYPAPVFLHLLALVRRHLFPSLSSSEGYRQVGRWHLVHYFESGIGRVFGKAFPLLGPDLVVQGVGKFSGAGNNFLGAKAFKVGNRHWRLAFHQTSGIPPDFLAGGLEYGLELARTPSTRKVVVANADPEKETFDLDITW